MSFSHFSATYSPEDNKLRLSSVTRLPKELYDRVKAAGFKWAPKQDIFVAPMWTPSREDLCIELAGEIDDEDTTLVDRAEQRAERFEGYKENRISDAENARAAVDRIADGIPMGQPILIGHHSERHARKDAQRIENGMRQTVKMWETAKYWEQRAAGALHHAKYKELPAVRYRRIKGLEADQRKQQRYIDDNTTALADWEKIAAIEDHEERQKMAIRYAGSSPVRVSMARKEGDRPDFDQRLDLYAALTGDYPNLYAPRTFDEVIEAIRAALPRGTARHQRWVDHYTNRIAYEKAMLGESGGVAADRCEMLPGGKIKRRGTWLVILKVNKRGGVLQSVTVSGHFATTVGVDEIQEYLPPKEGETEAVAAAMKLPPMCNYPGEGFKHMTTDEWKRKKMSDVSQSQRHKATETHGAHRTRSTWGGNWTTVSVYLTDAKRVDPPAAPLIAPPPLDLPKPERVAPEPSQQIYADVKKDDARIPSYSELDAMQKTAAAGVQVVAVPQLFPTPPDLARRMVELADIEDGHRVLEPSAGTGNILRAIDASPAEAETVAVEINNQLFRVLLSLGMADVHPGDFLEQNGNLGKFDRILMNPPFANADDIKHIEHALKFLKPGGRLVAICAGGPRQEARLMPQCDSWEPLPAGTFKESGTNVNTVLLTINV